MMLYLNNGYEVINYFAKFEKFLPHSIIIPSFMTVGSQMPELDQGAFLPPPYKMGSQNTTYKQGLKAFCTILHFQAFCFHQTLRSRNLSLLLYFHR